MKAYREFIIEAESSYKLTPEAEKYIRSMTDSEYSKKIVGAPEHIRQAWDNVRKGIQSSKPPKIPFANNPSATNVASTIRRTGMKSQEISRAPYIPQSTSLTSAPEVKPKPTNIPSTISKPSSGVLTKGQRFARSVIRGGAALGADIGTDIAIQKIPDEKVRTAVKTAKDIGMTFAAPIASLQNLEGSTPQRTEYQANKTTQISLPSNYNTPSYRKNPNDPRNAIFVQKTTPYTPGYDTKNPLDVTKWGFDKGGKPAGEAKPYGVAIRGGKQELVPYGSVAGKKLIGKPSSPEVVQARQQSSKSGAYGATKGAGVVGAGGQSFVSRTPKGAAFVSTGVGKQRTTAQLPSQMLLPTGKVGDLAFKGGKPTYLARPSIEQTKQNPLQRFARATNLFGYAEKEKAQQAQDINRAAASTKQYYSKLGISQQKQQQLNPALKPTISKPQVKVTSKV